MTHGDDDGLRLPPIIAPKQIVIVPILRDKPEDAAVVEYCEALGAELRALSAFGEPLRVQVDRKAARPIDEALELGKARRTHSLRDRGTRRLLQRGVIRPA